MSVAGAGRQAGRQGEYGIGGWRGIPSNIPGAVQPGEQVHKQDGFAKEVSEQDGEPDLSMVLQPVEDGSRRQEEAAQHLSQHLRSQLPQAVSCVSAQLSVMTLGAAKQAYILASCETTADTAVDCDEQLGAVIAKDMHTQRLSC